MKDRTDVSTPDALRPLDGVRVVSIALNLPGPACARQLADVGAGVIKVEPPVARGGDPMQQYAPEYYAELHADIEVRVLDLKAPADRATLDILLANADVLLTSQREAALTRLQLDWPTLSKQFPTLSQVAIVGAEHGDDAGHDLTYLAAAGLLSPPQLPTTLVADLGGAERAVAATFAALRVAECTGRGQRIVVSLETAAAAFSGPHRHGLTAPGGLLAGTHPGYNFYRASDGWIALAALEPHFAARVQTASQTAFTVESLNRFFSQQSTQYWQRWASEHDIPLAVVPSPDSSSTKKT